MISFRRGLRKNLPDTAAPGEPLVTTDSQELFIGTGTGIKKISDMIISEDAPVVSNNLKLWLKPSTNITSAYINGKWEPVGSSNSTDFGGF